MDQNENKQNFEEVDYKEEYEREHLRNADLAGRVADLEAKCDDLAFKLNRIKENPLWKMSAQIGRASCRERV